jgi:hypothetical protein
MKGTPLKNAKTAKKNEKTTNKQKKTIEKLKHCQMLRKYAKNNEKKGKKQKKVRQKSAERSGHNYRESSIIEKTEEKVSLVKKSC